MYVGPLDTEAFEDGWRRAGAGSGNRYRSVYDPVPGGAPLQPAPPAGSGSLLVVAGPEGSGRSSVIVASGLDGTEPRILDPGNYAEGLAGIEDVAIRRRVAEDACRVLRETLLERGHSFGIETTGGPEDAELIRRAKDAGYRVSLLLVMVSGPRICLERIAADGRIRPREIVEAGYARSMRSMQELIGLADRAEVLDNSGEHPVRVMSKRRSRRLHVRGGRGFDTERLEGRARKGVMVRPGPSGIRV